MNEKQKTTKARIYQVGTDDSIPGGITQVICDIMNSELKQTYKFIRIGTASHKKKIWKFIKGLSQICRDGSKGKIAGVHLHMSERASVYRKCIIILAAKRHRVPVILHSHGSDFQTFYEDLPECVKCVVKKIFNKVDYVIALTPGWREYWNCIMDDKGKVLVIPNFVRLPETAARFANDKFHVVFLGQLGKRKGTYDLIEAFESMNQENRKKYLVFLAGDGEIEQCRKLITSYRMNDIFQVMGWIGIQKKKELLSRANVLVLPSYFESFGIVLLEAMSYGIPVICSNGGFMKEIVRNGVDGMVVNCGRPDEILTALETLENNPQLCSQYGQNGRKRVQELYSEDKVIKQYKKLYQSLLSTAGDIYEN